jgi:hypothetical protein
MLGHLMAVGTCGDHLQRLRLTASEPSTCRASTLGSDDRPAAAARASS